MYIKYIVAGVWLFVDNDYTRAILSIFDFAIFYEVYHAYKENTDEPTDNMFSMQMCEAVTESVPQVVLQSVFIVRTWRENSGNFINNNNNNNTTDDDSINNNSVATLSASDISLIILSICASIISISNKFIKADDGVTGSTDTCVKSGLCCSKENVNKKNITGLVGYYIRVVWRLSCVTSRVVIYSMIWALIGGWYLAFYFCFECIFNIVLHVCCLGGNETTENKIFRGIFSIVSMFGYEKDNSNGYYLFYIHIIDNCISLTFITIFGLNKFECDITCADSENRNVNKNDAAMIYVIVGWVAITISTILMFIGGYFGYLINVSSCHKKKTKQPPISVIDNVETVTNGDGDVKTVNHQGDDQASIIHD